MEQVARFVSLSIHFFVDVNNVYICCILVRFISYFLERPLNFTALLWNKNLPVRSRNNSMDFCALGMTTNESDSHQYHTPMPRWLGDDDKWIMNSCGQCVSTDCSTTFARRPKQKHRLVQKEVSIVLFKKNMFIAFMLSRRYSLFQGWYATVLIESSMNREATSPVKKHTLKLLNIPSFLHAMYFFFLMISYQSVIGKQKIQLTMCYFVLYKSHPLF